MQQWASQDNGFYARGSAAEVCLQMGELSFDFAEGLVVGLGIDGKEKRILAAKWQEFTKNAFTFTVRPASILQSLCYEGTLLHKSPMQSGSGPARDILLQPCITP